MPLRCTGEVAGSLVELLLRESVLMFLCACSGCLFVPIAISLLLKRLVRLCHALDVEFEANCVASR